MKKKHLKIESEFSTINLSKNKEYHSNFIRNQISSRLIEEDLAGNLISNVLSIGEKIDENLWEFSIGPRWHFNTLKSDASKSLLEFIYHKINTPDGAWLSKLIKKIYQSDKKIYIETRFPILNINFFLTDLSISADQSLSDFFGEYTIWHKKNLILKPRDPNKYSFELINTPNRSVGKILYEENKIDICWGLGVPSSFFAENSVGFSQESSPPLHYYLNAGDFLSNESWDYITNILEYYETKIVGVEACKSRLIDGVKLKGVHLIETKSSKIPLYYSSFDPNKDVAFELEKITNYALKPMEVPYNYIVDRHEILNNGVTLSIRRPKHYGLLGKFPEIFTLLNQSDENNQLKDRIKLLFLSKDSSLKDFLILEKKINSACRQVVIGRIKPRFRSQLYIPFTSCGIVSLKDIT
ncbi:hypothetical protein F971_03206 [Acinetobacter vivianii]|uniref:Uncharacterized protein n=1 Tax=Acinetobacter vivianii TaxID=1776742 RepID=N8W8Q0_9GAMM|nr:hypothetical protein [Acinetobacter vivianii]ENU91299.1 hypothetical protein F971_03206 [Acinetobacter vivianii]